MSSKKGKDKIKHNEKDKDKKRNHGRPHLEKGEKYIKAGKHQSVVKDNTPVGQRHPFWAHDQIENTDDPFEDDFGENITRPLRNI